MNIENYSNVCRTCLTHTIDQKPVFCIEKIINREITLRDMLMTCASLTIIEGDGLPPNICLSCVEDLRRAFLFRQMCENSEHTLRNVAPSIVHKDTNNFVETNEKTEIVIPERHLNDWDDENLISNEPCDDDRSVKSVDFEDSLTEGETVKTNINAQENGRKKKSYRCEECKEECLGLAAYWKHMANAHGKTIRCNICEKEFKTQNLLKQHKTSHHQPNKNTDRETRRSRNKTGITKKRNLPRTCEICNKTFRFHSNLERHKLIHTGEKPYLCNVCGKGFGQMSYLKIHSFIHTGEKPYKCQMCEKSFAAPGTLMTHVRIHTGERPHVCKICGKDFPQSGYLSAHIRTHTGEKPVECKVCHRRFNQSGRLVIHMRIHSGEKPYSCKECGRCFAVRGTLKKHIRTHTGERPYVCSVCGQAFAQSGTLATHMKVHRAKQ